MSGAQDFWNLFARWAEKPLLAAIPNQPLLRRVAGLHARLFYRRRRDMRFRPEALGGVPCVRCDRGGDDGQGVLLYLHGGAYTLGGPGSHRHWVAELAHLAGLSGVLVDYRLAPEHPFPAALDDALAAYRAVLASTPATRIALAGDSAGGGLAFALLSRLAVEGLPAPAAVLAFSPWTDLTLSSPSIRQNRRSEMMLPLAWLKRGARAYAGSTPPEDPGVSPVFATFTAPPPTLIMVGAGEVLRDDSRRVAERLRAGGGQVTLEEVTGVGHDWPIHLGLSPEADAANARAAAFLRGMLQTS